MSAVGIAALATALTIWALGSIALAILFRGSSEYDPPETFFKWSIIVLWWVWIVVGLVWGTGDWLLGKTVRFWRGRQT